MLKREINVTKWTSPQGSRFAQLSTTSQLQHSIMIDHYDHTMHVGLRELVLATCPNRSYGLGSWLEPNCGQIRSSGRQYTRTENSHTSR